MSKINVLELLPTFGDGGLERVVANYCAHINRNKYKLFVMTIFNFNKGDCYDIALKSKCEVCWIFNIIRCWDNNILIRIYKKLFSKTFIKYKLKKYIKERKINVIHAHNDVLQYLSLLSGFLKKNNIKLIYTCHSFPSRWLGENYFEEHNAAINLLKNNNLLICALHSEMTNEIKKILNTKNVIVLENLIDLSIFKNDGSMQSTIRKRLNIPIDSFVIGNVCRLVKSKNLNFLIEVFAECYEIDNSCFLVIACNNDVIAKQELMHRIHEYKLNNRVLFLTGENIPDILKTMDVYCSPSLIEGFSISLLEAQASGLKCVYSDINPKEINLNKSNLILSLKSDKKFWAKSILSIKNKKSVTRKEIHNYNVDKVVKKIESLYYIQ